MNNVKKLLAVLVVVTMLVTAMIPVMAADTFSYGDEAAVLYDLGLFAGQSSTEYIPDLGSALTREQGVVMLVRLLGAEADALALTAAEVTASLSIFTDKAEISFWAANYVAYAVDSGFFVGVGDNKADPKGALLGKAYATMVLRAMGYIVDATDYNTAALILYGVDGLSLEEAFLFNDKQLIRDDAIGMTYAALSGTMADGGTLIEALVTAGAVDEDAAVASGLYVAPVVVVADVKDVTISALKEVVVTFTAPINATEAAKVANYSIAAGANVVTAAVVSADMKTVTLTPTTSFTNYASYAVLVKAAVGIPADVTKTVKASDITVPTLLSAVPTGPKSIKLTFSEALNAVTQANVIASFKLDNSTLAITTDIAGVAAGSKTIIINTYVNLAETSHTIALSGALITDLAGYAVQPTSLVFDYVKDTSPLSYTVGATTETTVKLTFNKAIAAGTLIGNANLTATHTYNTPTNQVTNAAITTSDNQTFTITFANPLPPAASTVFVNYTSASSTLIADGYGNTIPASFSFPVTTAPDLTKPTATVAFVNATTLTVTYSENVTAAATTPANYVLKDSAGTAIAVNAAAFTTNFTVVSLTTAPMNGGAYTLTVSNVVDTSIAANAMGATTLSFTGTDKIAPTMGAITTLASDKVKIAFSESMDISTITNKLAYKYLSTAVGAVYTTLAATDTVTAAADGKSVIIDFDMAVAVHADPIANLKLAIATFKDLAGNWVDGYDLVYGIPPLTNLTATAAVTGGSTIKLTIADSTVTGMTINDFAYSIDNGVNYLAPTSIAVEYDATNTYVTLYTQAVMNAATTDATNIVVSTNVAGVYGIAVPTVKNSYANTLKITAVAATDKYAPAVAVNGLGVKQVLKTVDLAGKITKIDVIFTENLYVPSVQDTDFTVSGTTVVSVSVAGNIVTIDVVDVTNVATTVTLVAPIEDAVRNVLASFAATTAQ